MKILMLWNFGLVQKSKINPRKNLTLSRVFVYSLNNKKKEL